MKLIKSYYEIITPINGEEILKQIELAARTCYQSEGRIEYKKTPYTDGVHQVIVGYYEECISARPLIQRLIASGHHAMIEFGGMITVKFTCDRGVSHELVRHRLCSFAQESTRYCNYNGDKFGEGITFIIPSWIAIPEGVYNITLDENHDEECLQMANIPTQYPERGWHTWCWNMLSAEQDYKELINQEEWTPQQARAVLPNSLKTEINMSANIREWREIFKQRTSNAAHPQMQELMRPLLKEFQTKIPLLFDDITY